MLIHAQPIARNTVDTKFVFTHLMNKWMTRCDRYSAGLYEECLDKYDLLYIRYLRYPF